MLSVFLWRQKRDIFYIFWTDLRPFQPPIHLWTRWGGRFCPFQHVMQSVVDRCSSVCLYWFLHVPVTNILIVFTDIRNFGLLILLQFLTNVESSGFILVSLLVLWQLVSGNMDSRILSLLVFIHVLSQIQLTTFISCHRCSVTCAHLVSNLSNRSLYVSGIWKFRLHCTDLMFGWFTCEVKPSLIFPNELKDQGW